ncbi:alpha/beta fold hydrolase [Ancylobacter terrae]|uniref:alpha/beta fold hydrolase n=1 Tax=Ancylobacter sp. sgz301288 TaxID=3342077 RepID=UPI003858A9CA
MKPSPVIVRTPHADIALRDSGGVGMPVLLLHGNSSCKDVFRHQMEGALARRYRMIAMDLAGHGESGDASDVRAYTIPGHAETALYLLDLLGIPDAAVLGWSLGGHIGIEMLARRPSLRGLMIIGAPPYAHGFLGMARAFHVNLNLLLMTRARLSEREARRLTRATLGTAYDPAFVDAVLRTDVRARPELYRGMMKAEGADQKRTIESADVPVAVVNGAGEPFARLDYLADLAYGDLWDGRCHVIEGAGHAPFLERPDLFDPILDRFLSDLATRRAARQGRMMFRTA